MFAGEFRELVPGAIIAGKYRVEKEIARGGQGTVVKATHLALDQPVAIKFSHLDGPRTRERMRRLVYEARAAFRLRGEHVSHVIDVDVVDGTPFIVMEYLEGIDLKTFIASRAPLPCSEAVGLMLQTCEGIAEAHDLGIVHRDLKPSNLFLVDRSGATPLLKVLDFGIAKRMTPALAEGDSSLTEPLVLLGSPRYMSPEQARDPRQADERTDIWSMGLIFHELLTGQPVFRARTVADVLALVLREAPVPVSRLRPDVPPEIERVILCCLQKAPEHRFSTVRELATELLPFASAAGLAMDVERPEADSLRQRAAGNGSAPDISTRSSAGTVPLPWAEAEPTPGIVRRRWVRRGLVAGAAVATVIATLFPEWVSGARPLFAHVAERPAAPVTRPQREDSPPGAVEPQRLAPRNAAFAPSPVPPVVVVAAMAPSKEEPARRVEPGRAAIQGDLDAVARGRPPVGRRLANTYRSLGKSEAIADSPLNDRK